MALYLSVAFIESNFVYSFPKSVKSGKNYASLSQSDEGGPRPTKTRLGILPNTPGQSPISITKLNSFLNFIPRLQLNLYDKEIPSMKLTNNDESAVLSPQKNFPTDQTPYLSGSSFPNNYQFVQLHFHWGPDSAGGGSEHLLRSKRYAAELHLVHYNTKYNSFAEATNHADGLAVLGVLMDTTNNPSDNPGLEKLVKQFNEVTASGSETNLTSPLKLNELLPQNTQNFYRYRGSLTTPKYAEIVTWTVLKTPLLVSERQVAAFRTLLHSDGKPITKNYREAQAVNNRLVLLNWRPNIFG